MEVLFIMTTEEKINYLGDKLARTLEVLKLLVLISSGLNKTNTEWFVEQIEELQQWEGWDVENKEYIEKVLNK